MMVQVTIEFEAWRNRGKDRTQMYAEIFMPLQLVMQLEEAAECEHPAGIPDKVSTALEEVAKEQGWHFDHVTQVFVSARVLKKANEAMKSLANGIGGCELCAYKNAGGCDKCESDEACSWCEKIVGTPCEKCLVNGKMEKFEWDGSTGTDENE